jgi:AefR-like transcriptional repressor, C-terminal domain
MGVMLGALARMFKRAMDRGEIIPEDPEVLAHLFIAPVAKTIIWHFTFAPTDATPFPVRAHLQAHVRLFMRGLKPSSAGDAK